MRVKYRLKKYYINKIQLIMIIIIKYSNKKHLKIKYCKKNNFSLEKNKHFALL